MGHVDQAAWSRCRLGGQGNLTTMPLGLHAALSLPCAAESGSSATQYSPAKCTARQRWSNFQARRRQRKLRRDLRIVAAFVKTYCDGRHPMHPKSEFHLDSFGDSLARPRQMELCPSCQKLLAHAMVKRVHCPLNPKPACKKCSEHCYAPRYREKMREVMRYSGLQLIRSGRLNYLIHLLF